MTHGALTTGPQASRPQAAFTLIELLVVIAVISLLLALLTPTVRAARRQAKATQCLSNVTQCARALSTYLEDSRGMCPPWITFDACQPIHGNWWWTCCHYLFQEYMGRDTIRFWSCPADDTNDCSPWDGNPRNGDWFDGYRFRCSYVYNNGGGSSAHAAFEGLSLSITLGKDIDSIKNPSKKIAMFCWCAHNFWSGEGPGVERLQWWHSVRPQLKAPVSFLDYSGAVVTIVPGQAETREYKW